MSVSVPLTTAHLSLQMHKQARLCVHAPYEKCVHSLKECVTVFGGAGAANRPRGATGRHQEAVPQGK